MREFTPHSLIGGVMEVDLMTALAAIARILAVLQFHGSPVSTADVRVVGSVASLLGEDI